MTIRILLIFFLVWSSSFAFAQNARELVGQRYANVEQCSAVLHDLNRVPDNDPLALSMVTQICYVSRLADHVARQMALQRDQDEPPRLSRSTDRQITAPPREEPLQALETSLDRASTRRDELLDEFVQSDPHEANDILKRLLGPGDDKKG